MQEAEGRGKGAERHFELTYIMRNSFLELWRQDWLGRWSGNEESRADAITAVPVG